MNPEGLAHERFGDGQPPLAFVHGFTQTRESWRPIASRFAPFRQVELIDLPGHGKTTATDIDLPTAGRLLAKICAHHTVIGYSMGARVALHAALHTEAALSGLALIGAHPGIAADGERDERRRQDETLASRIEEVGVETFIEDWLSQPMFAAVRHLGRADRLSNTAHGLAESLRHLGTGTQDVLDDQLGRIRCPVLLMVGEKDTKFLQLAERMAERIETSRIVTIAGAGHACHLEQPEATFEVLREWIDSLGDGESTR